MPLATTIREQLNTLSYAQARLTSASLSMKVQQLRQSRSTDRVQQLQTEAIVEIYDAVKQIQDALWPLLSTLPDVGAVRDAAAAAGNSSIAKSVAMTPKVIR